MSINFFLIPEYIFIIFILYIQYIFSFKWSINIFFIFINLFNIIYKNIFKHIFFIIFIFFIILYKNFNINYINLIFFYKKIYIIFLLLYFYFIFYKKKYLFFYKKYFYKLLFIIFFSIFFIKFYEFNILNLNYYFLNNIYNIYILLILIKLIIYIILSYIYNFIFLEKIFFIFINLNCLCILFNKFFVKKEIFSLHSNFILNNFLIKLHIPCFILSYSFLIICGILSLMFIIINNNIKKNNLQKIVYKFYLFSFLLFTLGNIIGSFWAKIAWGNYWNWDPKEIWSLILWFFYLIWFHIYNLNLKNNFINYISILNVFLLFFLFFGINYFYKYSFHLYG